MNRAPERTRKEILSENIRHLIKINKTSEKQVCEETGIRRSVLSSWICKIHIPRDENLKVLADYFMVSIADLYKDYSDEARKRSFYTIAQKRVILRMEEDPVFNEFVLEGLELSKRNEQGRLERYIDLMQKNPYK